MQIGLLFLETISVGLLILVVFRLRRILGLSPLYATIGALQFLQVALTLSVYVDVAPGISVSPGSSILFPASLCAVLLVYMWEDAAEARTLIACGILRSSSIWLHKLRI